MNEQEKIKTYLRHQGLTPTEYENIHIWLRKNYGKASKCESKTCKRNSKKYEWALSNGCIYEKKRANFLQLCKSCHVQYDRPRSTYFEYNCLVCKKSFMEWSGKKQKFCSIACSTMTKEVPVVAKYPDGRIETYPSLSQAARSLGLLKTSIANMLAGRSKIAGGAIWQYQKHEELLTSNIGK